MKEKNTIGLNLKYFNAAFLPSIIGLIALFLPYVSQTNDKASFINVILAVFNTQHGKALAYLIVVAVLSTILVAVMSIVNRISPSVIGVRVWVLAGVVGVFSYTVLLFASKSIIDAMGIVSEPFLVKNFGLGYWIGLLAAYVSLIMTMKIAKINTGYIALVIMSVIWLFPILWIIITSFRAEEGYYVGYFIPRGFTLDNYKALFNNPSLLPFAKWWGNTFIVAISCSLITTLIVLATAYVLSRTRFTGRVTIMKLLLIVGMFPGFMSMIAVYNILKGIGLNQSLVALIVVGVAGAAMGYHVCKGFFDTIPKSLDEAAILDGATRWQIFTKITIPLSKPIIIYTILSSFLAPWSDYIFPSMLLGDKQASYTVAIGLKWMTDYRRIDTYYTQFAAGAILVAVPIVILFIWLQRFYVEGLSGSVKG